MAWHQIAFQDPLRSGESKTTMVKDKEILISRVGTAYYAVAGRCTHAAWPLSPEEVEGFEVVCTLHGARFDLRDGCPTTGPASKPLAIFPIELRNGELYVSL